MICLVLNGCNLFIEVEFELILVIFKGLAQGLGPEDFIGKELVLGDEVKVFFFNLGQVSVYSVDLLVKGLSLFVV